MKTLELKHGCINLPAFFPDGTRGVVRCLDAEDLENCNIQGLVMNSYHLMTKPGPSTIKAIGGLNEFINWKHPILTDSGGFQVFSLIRENSKFGEIDENKIVFKSDSEKEKIIFTAEKCIKTQLAYGSDILMCLDYCTHPNDPYEVNRKSIDITIAWAKRCKEEFKLQIKNSKKLAANPPKLFGIIQGANDKALRKECAEALIDIGFEGFGFGGWPLDNNGVLVDDILEYTAALMPNETVKYAMGLGKPEEIVRCFDMGYDLFDCVIPTREARHKRLYVFNDKFESLSEVEPRSANFYKYYYVTDDKYHRDGRPISEICDCHCCKNYSRAYLRHLYLIGDSLAHRLATIHNLAFYTQLMDRLRVEKG